MCVSLYVVPEQHNSETINSKHVGPYVLEEKISKNFPVGSLLIKVHICEEVPYRYEQPDSIKVFDRGKR